MFESLYMAPHDQARHCAGPLAAERERYLQYRAAQGATSATLKSMAGMLLWVARKINPSQGRSVTMDQIRRAASWWASRPRRVRLKRPRQVRQNFAGAATGWLRYLGRLQPTQSKRLRHEKLLDDCARWMRHECELSPMTVEVSLRSCRRFLTWYEARRKPFSKVSAKDVDTFFVTFNKHQRWSRGTVAAMLDGIKRLFRYAAGRGLCRPIAQDIPSPRIYRYESLPLGPRREDVVRLVSSMRTNRSSDIRDLAMVLLCAVYGLRAGEVIGLRMKDIDWENDRISVWRSKARRRQNFALVATVGNAILRYLKEGRPRCDQHHLFLSLRAPIRPITGSALASAVSNRMAALGIHAPRRGPHGLRHAFGCHLLDGKFSLKEIGDLMGHRRSVTTRIYAKVDLPVLRHVALLDLGGVI